MLRRTRAWLWPFGIAIACSARTEPGVVRPPTASVRDPAGSAATAPRGTADPNVPPAVRPALPLQLELLQRFPAADARHPAPWKTCLSWAPTSRAAASARAVVVPALELPAGASQFVQLDAFVPLQWVPADETHGELALSRLSAEFTPLSDGVHRVSRFALNADGHVLLDSSGQPLHCALSFELPAGAEQDVGRQQGHELTVFSPFGTLNGAAATSTLVQVWWPEPTRGLLLSVEGPGGRGWQQVLTSGKYRLSGLQAGRYTFELRLDPAGVSANTDSTLRTRWSLNVNPELGEPQEQ